MRRDDTKLIEALKIFGQTYVAELGDQLRKLDKKASGKLLSSLETRVIKTGFGTDYTIEILAEDYLKYVDDGRKPNLKPPPIAEITRWTRLKGIPQRLAFPIAKSIGKIGIEPTNVIAKTLAKVTRSRGLNVLEDDMADWVDDIVGQLLFDISKNKNITVKK